MTRKEGPDQPRSWAVVFAAFIIYALQSGITRTTGIFYVALIQTYGASRLQANLPFTIRNIVKNMAGPLVGALGQRFGPRNVTLLGGVLASLGIILCTFAPNVIWIAILWGGMHGLGVALGSTLSQVIVPQYFLKYRSTASGISLSGPCLGSFILPILLEYLLANIGLAGTFLVTGGIMMHVLPFSLMMEEPPWLRRKTKEELYNLQSKPPSQDISDIHKIITTNQETLKTKTQDFKSETSPNSKRISPVENLEKGTNIFESVNKTCNGIDNPAFDGSQLDLNGAKLDQFVAEPMTRARPQIHHHQPASDHVQETSISVGVVKVLRNPMFHLISLSFAAFAMVVDPALTVIVDYLMDKGHEEDVAKYFIIMMSISDLIGRIGFGWVTDNNYLSVSKFMMILHAGLGCCFLLMPSFNNFDSLLTVVVLYGLFSGAILVMFPILVGRYLQTVQSLAIGFSAFFSGLLSFTVPPLIGYFRDRVGSYDGMFYMTGGMSVVVGICWWFEPFLLGLDAKLRKEQSDSVVLSS